MTKRTRDTSIGAVFSALALVGQVGLTMSASIGLGVVAGLYLDRWLKASGIVLVLMIGLGIAGGGYGVYKLMMKGAGR
ncbi:MAG: AtpZ/AtpI family protein [Candidatus Hydrogenedentota bacterium]